MDRTFAALNPTLGRAPTPALVLGLTVGLALGLTACGGGGDGGSGGAEDVGAGGAGGDGTGGAPPSRIGSGGRAEGQPVGEALAVVRFQPDADGPATPLATVPFPSDLYRTEDGALDLRGFTRPTGLPLLNNIVDAIEGETAGFGTSATMYISFESPVFVDGLPPDAVAAQADDASLFVVDVDPDSPERGRRWPINWRLQDAATDYLPSHTVKVRLVEGMVLRPSTTYALVVTEAVGTASAAFAATLADAAPEDPALRAAWDIHAPLRAWLAESGVASAGASVFTTQDPVGELFQARDFVHSLPAPELLEIESHGIKLERFEEFRGVYRAPRFQEGTIPYTVPGNGAMRFDADGDPIVAGEELIRFSLSIPLEDQVERPEGGWPVVMYGHGTGGNWRSYIGGDVGSVNARNATATISIDQIHHGDRDNGACDNAQNPGVCVQPLFFNFIVPQAGRDNVRQSALDFVSLLRFVQTLEIPEGTSELDRDIPLSRENIMYMGHSQGGLNGPLLLAIEPLVTGAMLSGAGAGFPITLEQKRQPQDLNAFLAGILRLDDADPLDRWHPILALLQTYIEPADGVNYGEYWFHRPRAGARPKSIFMTVGLEDEYTTPDSTFALATSARVPLIEDVAVPVEGLELFGVPPEIPPYQGNVAGGSATAGLAQYPGEGHFLIFEVPSARQRYGRFMQSLAEEDPPRIF